MYIMFMPPNLFQTPKWILVIVHLPIMLTIADKIEF